MFSSRLISLLLTAILSFSLIGCSVTPSEQQSYSQNANNTLAAENQQLFNRGLSTQQTTTLLDLIPDPILLNLIEQALRGNPSLQRTALSLEANRLSVNVSHANRLPQANVSVSANEVENSDTRYSSSVNISWQLDVWSKLADAENAAQKNLASAHELFRASQATLVSSVMKNWLQLVANQHAITIEKKRLALLETNERLIVQRFRNGLGTLENLDEAKTATSQSRASLAQYQEEFASSKRALRLLMGSNQTEPFTVPKKYPSVWLDLNQLPIQDLSQRPDLRAAYLSIEAADLEASVAYKDMLPSLSLSAVLSDSGSSLRDALFVSPIWSLLGQLSAPLFQGGRLKANYKIAQLETAQAYQDYRETLLTAVNEVENTLGQEQVLTQRRQYLQAALNSAESNRQQYEQKYRSGIVALNDLISAQQAVFNLQAQLDTLLFQQLSNRVDLGLALGLGITQP